MVHSIWFYIMFDWQKLSIKCAIQYVITMSGAVLKQLAGQLVHILVEIDAKYLLDCTFPQLIGGPNRGAHSGSKVEQTRWFEVGLLVHNL